MLARKYFPHIVVGVFVGVTIILFNLINEVQNEAYLDEVFHIPQAQKYCNWKFYEWDPKITTLPGLYLLSVGALTPLMALLGVDMCGAYVLRATNVLATFANLYVLYCIHQKLHPFRKEKNVMSAVNLAVFPVLYFFTFLYYTDVLATLLVLLMYLLHLHRSRLLSAATGLLAVVTRQTNIIWVGFLLLDTVARVLKDTANSQRKKTSGNGDSVANYLKFLLSATVCASRGKQALAMLVKQLFQETVFLCSVCLAFVCFIAWNKGIVVGDRSAHQAVVHVSQIHYFSLFAVCFGFPYLSVYAKSVFTWLRMHKREATSLAAVSLLVVHFNTLVHPYLLADNRHYTFYIWKRLYERYVLAKYLLVPVYLYGIISSLEALRSTCVTTRMSFALCVALSLVPQKLLELRYYILPYLFLRLHMSHVSWWQLLLEFMLYAAVNAATVYLFITRTFSWPHSDELHRFMW